MKNLKTWFALIATTIAIQSHAYDFQSNGIYYNILSDKQEVEVTYDVLEHSGYQGIVELPSEVTHNGTTYAVTAIGDKAFYKSTITTIHIPNGITSIGEFAFYSSESLKNITLPQTLTTLKKYALSGTPIPSIAIPEGVKSIDQGGFQSCEQLHTVFLPSTLTSIGSYGFYADHSLKEIYIPADHVINATAYAVFQGIDDFDIIVHDNQVDNYSSTAPWSSFSVYPPEEFSLSMTIRGTRHDNYDEVELDEDKAFKIYDNDSLIAITSSPTYLLPNAEQKTYKFVPTDYFYEAAPLYYTTSTSSVSQIENNNSQLYITNDILHIDNTLQGQPLEIYTLTGTLISKTTATETIQLTTLPTGTYLIRCNGKVLKYLSK